MSTAAPYLISKVADPLFALFIGTMAAGTRINREEQEKGRAGGMQIVDIFKRRWAVAMEDREESNVVLAARKGQKGA